MKLTFFQPGNKLIKLTNSFPGFIEKISTQNQTHKTHKLISVTHETHKKLIEKLIKNLGLLRAGIAKLLHRREYSKYSFLKYELYELLFYATCERKKIEQISTIILYKSGRGQTHGTHKLTCAPGAV